MVFTECPKDDTRQKQNSRHNNLRRVLPLGKQHTRQLHVRGNIVDLRYHFAKCHPLTHGKPTYMPSVKIQHSANPTICRVSAYDTRQTIFFDFASQTFCTVVLQYMLLYVEVLYISELFYYISSIYFSQMNFR